MNFRISIDVHVGNLDCPSARISSVRVLPSTGEDMTIPDAAVVDALTKVWRATFGGAWVASKDLLLMADREGLLLDETGAATGGSTLARLRRLHRFIKDAARRGGFSKTMRNGSVMWRLP